ncbi:MAG: hypothetical protein AAGE52_31205 [Myxococcota bacterium]
MLESRTWEFRPMKIGDFQSSFRTFLHNQHASHRANLLDAARAEEALMINPTWNSLLYAARLGKLAAWGTDP